MIEQPLTIDERKYLLARVTSGALVGLFLLCLPLLFCLLDFSHLENFWFFLFIKNGLTVIWLVGLLLFLSKTLSFYLYILRNHIQKITDEFKVTCKEKCTTTFDTGSDSHCFYVHLVSAKHKFRVQIDVQDYEKLKEDELVLLHYFSHIYLLVGAEYRGNPLDFVDASVVDTKPRFVFLWGRVLSRYYRR